MLRCALAAIAAVIIAAPAAAQLQRNFPREALRGSLIVAQPPEVVLNGKPARLAPGSRIRDQSNLLQVAGALVGQRNTVHYTVDIYGLIKDVWVLTPAELDNVPWPTTAAHATGWHFDPVGQRWARP